MVSRLGVPGVKVYPSALATDAPPTWASPATRMDETIARVTAGSRRIIAGAPGFDGRRAAVSSLVRKRSRFMGT
jgi:hypothetical protein